MEQFETRVRARITEYTAAGFTLLASLIFLTAVPFIPESPILPLFIAIALAFISLQNRGISVAILYLLVLVATIWQMIGFGFFQLLRAGVGFAVIIALMIPLLMFYSRRVELTSMSLAILCVSLLFTPAYFVSVPLIAAAATVTGFASLEAISLSFIFFAFPFLLLDNALYFVTTPGATTPIVFSQFIYLNQNLRPALPGLNLFLTGVPPNFISPLAPAVSAFLANNWPVLVIPLLVLGVTIFASASFGGLVRRYMLKFAAAREWKGRNRVWAPLFVSLAVPLAFMAILVPLSLPAAGDFRTGLTSDPTNLPIYLTLASSAVLGMAFVGRDVLVEQLERTELAREKVLDLVSQSKMALTAAEAEIFQIQHNIPLVSTSGEELALKEHSSFIIDVERRAKDADKDTLLQWQNRLETVVLPSLKEVKGRLMNEVLNEFSTLRGIIAAVNGHLSEASVPFRYSLIPEIDAGVSIDYLTDLYQLSAKRIEEETSRLFTAYKSAFEAENQLLESKDATIPVAPDNLLETHEYGTAMRLVSEDYWLNFHLRSVEEFQEKCTLLLEEVSRLRPYLGPQEATQFDGIAASLDKAVPADSAMVLDRMLRLRDLLSSLLTKLADSPEVLKKTVNTINPAASRVLSFQTERLRNDLVTLQKELASTGVGLRSLTGFLKDATPVIAAQASALKSDSEGVITLAHYPEARRVVKNLLVSQAKLGVEQLPYEKHTAASFLRLYAREATGTVYDESEGVLVVGT